MKILYLITRAETGGAQVHVRDLTAALVRDHQVTIAVGEEGFLTSEARRLGAAVVVIPNLVQPLSPVRDVRAVDEALDVLRSVRPDVVHLHSSKAGIVGRLAARFAGVPSVFTAHGWAFTQGAPWQRKSIAMATEAVAARWCRKIITVSDNDRNLALRYRIANQSKLTTVHNGIPDSDERANPGMGGEVRLVMVARFAAPKNHAVLVRALRWAPFPFKLQFVGDGPLRADVERLVQDLGMQDKVEFLGERANVATILAQAHVLALASSYEGFPLTVLEAMRAGLPVIASDVGGVREAVDQGVSGFLISRGSDAEWLSRISALASSPELRARFGAEARRRFERLFRHDLMVSRVSELYHGMLS